MARSWHGQLRRFAADAVVALLLLTVVMLILARFTELDLEVGGLVVRSQQGSRYPFPVNVHQVAEEGAARTATQPDDLENVAEGPRALRNVIVVIADGLGLSGLSSGSILLFGPGGELAIENAPVTGLVKTHAANDLVTDSAAAATALATGYKTNRRMVGKLPSGESVRTLLEAAAIAGKATGVVTTTGLADATPAGFAAHARSRRDWRALAEQMVDSELEVMIGGDGGIFEKAATDPETAELVAHIEHARATGLQIARTVEEIVSVDSGRLMALLPRRPGSVEGYGPPLATTARLALDLLAADPDGFVVMIEAEEPDLAGHTNNIRHLVEAVRELDDTVRVVLGFAGGRDDTLVIVTADHETGGPAIVDGDFAEGRAIVRWSTHDHTGSWVPLFAFGPGAERFAGVHDNTEIALLIGQLLALPDFPAVVPVNDA